MPFLRKPLAVQCRARTFGPTIDPIDDPLLIIAILADALFVETT
jgi:hypothetical protein